MAFDLQTYRCQPAIGFRVEVHDERHRDRNCTFYYDEDDDGDNNEIGNMRSRDPYRTGDAQACRDHLQWDPPGGPFISFFTSWSAALRRRQVMLNNRAREVVIVAVWLNGLPLVYNALQIAKDLRLGRLHRFQNEVLVYGGISADSYRVLAIFSGKGKIKEAALYVNGSNTTVKIPGEFIDEVSIKRTAGAKRLPDATEILRNEIYIRTGMRDDARFIPLASSMAEPVYSRKVDNAGTMIHWPVWGRGWRFPN